MTKKTIFISTGEVSGDLQGAMLIDALKRQATHQGLDLNIVALGGEKMALSGAKILGNTTDIGSVGLLESLPFVLPTLTIQRRAKQYLKHNPPDLVVLIDYMGPNLGIGTFIQRQLPHVPVVYYIAPQEWVWSLFPHNTATIVEMTNKLLAIFPEEARYFEKKGASVHWVGHPLVDRIQSYPSREQARAALGIKPDQTAIALLPASRHQEIKYMMPIIFSAAQQLQEKLSTCRDVPWHVWEAGGDQSTVNCRGGFSHSDKLVTDNLSTKPALIQKSKLPQSSIPNSQSPIFWIPLSHQAYRKPIEKAIEDYGLQATLVTEKTEEVLTAADLAITKSGTVNLELALLNVPQVVFYRVSPLTYWIAHTFLNFSIPFMSPPNLVVMRSIVPELLQAEATPENLVREAMELLFDPQKRQQTLTNYQQMRQLLGEVGVCDRAALAILQLVHPLGS
ncbi:lipid-A-disaccharide synthase [Coleofasciculus sp. E1-EBD-02]|uniref:lipid-A-disaccharide synthase n=1 Tax=Coleofasciculus sp. E1-EBD-02 TaxID=3068481 RepID=UPI003300ABF3